MYSGGVTKSVEEYTRDFEQLYLKSNLSEN